MHEFKFKKQVLNNHYHINNLKQSAVSTDHAHFGWRNFMYGICFVCEHNPMHVHPFFLSPFLFIKPGSTLEQHCLSVIQPRRISLQIVVWTLIAKIVLA
jgi:hypothetical protein